MTFFLLARNFITKWSDEYIVELHVLANTIKRPRLDNIFILQHSFLRVASSDLNVDRKWTAIFLFNIALMCGFLEPKRGPKVNCNIFI
jgi:hypothetical protein